MADIGRNQQSAYGEYLRRNGNRGFDWRYPALALGAPLAGAVAPALFGAGGAAASVPGAVGASAAPLGEGTVIGATGAGGMTFGNLLKLGELGTGLVTNLIGQRQQNHALDQDASARANEFAQQMALLTQQNQQAQRQWEAEQAQRAQDYTLTLEDRRMAQEDRARRNALEDAAEARRADYRSSFGQPALMRLRDLLHLGGR